MLVLSLNANSKKELFTRENISNALLNNNYCVCLCFCYQGGIIHLFNFFLGKVNMSLKEYVLSNSITIF